MSYSYDQRKRPQGQKRPAPESAAAPGPAFDALMSGTARPSSAQKGRPIDLDAAMKAKMEHAFGDLSAVRFYESPTVGQAGAEAMAMGNEIAFAPGMADFSTRTGQERLGHELSHVMSQRSGAVQGHGFLASSALEAKADREGALAAVGGQVYTGPVTSALSDASPFPSAAGPMQAKRNTEEGYRAVWQADKEANFPEYKEALSHMNDAPAQPDKRPWEYTAEELQANSFNPSNNPLLHFQQKAIDVGESPEMAFSSFSYLSSKNGSSKLKDGVNKFSNWNPYYVDPKLFKAKLKQMARMIHDYPELQGKIGNITKENAHITVMSADSARGGADTSNLTYNPSIDSMSTWGRIKHFLFHHGNRIFGITNQTSMDYTPTHELGHTLNSLLLNDKNIELADKDWAHHVTANKVVEEALRQTMKEEEFKNLKRYKESKGEHLYGQIDLSGSKLRKKGYTSRYGETSASEFFAEAFADVYSHGADAKPVSIAVVKEYEKLREEKKNRPEFSGLEDIADNDLLEEDPLNSSMIARPPKKKRK